MRGPITDYHVHVERGSYTLEWLEEFVAQATRAGVTDLGISEHAYRFEQTRSLLSNPWVEQRKTEDLEEYLAMLQAARKKGIAIKFGIEMDFMPDNAERMRDFLASYPFDYAIGSIHWLGGFGFDLDEMRSQWEESKVEDVYQTYFQLLEQLIESRCVDIIGHADVIKVFGFKVPEVAKGWYERLTPKIKRSGLAVEVSTAGWRKPVKEIYPAPEWLPLLIAENIPLVLSSDAHRPEDVGAHYPQALDLLRALGAKGLVGFDSRRMVVS